MTVSETISNQVEIIEYNGYNRPLFFEFILSNTTIPKGLKDFSIKGIGIGLTVNNFTINGGTTEYSVAPTVEITGGGGSGAKAIAILNTSKIVSGIQITDPGQDYTSAPTITFSGGTISKAGTNPTGTGIFNKPTNFIPPPSSLKPNTYVWILEKGAYLTQGEDQDWLYLEDLTILMTKISKIYTTNSRGEFLVNQTSNINDRLNQIHEIINGKGYIVISDPRTSLPYVWYEYFPKISSTPQGRVTFNIEECYIINKQNTDFIDNTAKAIKLGDQRHGTCMKDLSATISVVVDLTDLQKNKDYHIHLDSLNKDVYFIEQDIYLNNNQLANHSVYAKLKFLEHNVNNIFDIRVSLNIGNNEIDRDILSIYVDCPPRPEPTPTPRPAQPVVRIVE